MITILWNDIVCCVNGMGKTQENHLDVIPSYTRARTPTLIVIQIVGNGGAVCQDDSFSAVLC